jgi:sialate O-acetylesterase
MRIKFLFLFLLNFSFFLSAQISIPKVFSSHMVLQRDINIPVWGKAKAGIEVIAELGNSRSSAKADENGNWSLRLPQFKAGGPYKLIVYEAINPGSKIEFDDVLIGDVWLASGQSNMELQVKQAKDAQLEISKANHPNIRFFFVPHEKSLKPETDIKDGSWGVCDTNSIKSASAVAYYFAREIQSDLNVPVGILQSTWGGTPVEAWTSREMLLSSPIRRQKILDNDSLSPNHFVKDSLDLIKFWDIVYNPKNAMDQIIPQSAYDDSKWPVASMPKANKDWGLPVYEGMCWLRKSIDIPGSFAGKDLTINLGHPEMNYSLYFNGEEICKNTWNSSISHLYALPARLVKKGENSIVVRMAFLWGGGGFNPPAGEMYLTDGKSKISLTGNWKYQKDLEPAIPKIENYQYYPSLLYNAMINPVVPYGIKGFIWYQGEANDTGAYHYRTLFPMLITDWRIRWQQGYLPFLYVQLPNYKKAQTEPSESEWAELREAQTLALSQPNTGMACTIDIGNADNIHPTNKQEVGHRLALAALKTAYGKSFISSGPMLKNFRIEETHIRISFTETGSGLATNDHNALKGFAIAGKDKRFYWATAKIEGNEVIVSSEKVPEPIAVRYAWADNPDCNLVNKEGLLAVPFRTDKWRGITEK